MEKGRREKNIAPHLETLVLDDISLFSDVAHSAVSLTFT